jgi:hypothetical protein
MADWSGGVYATPKDAGSEAHTHTNTHTPTHTHTHTHTYTHVHAHTYTNSLVTHTHTHTQAVTKTLYAFIALLTIGKRGYRTLANQVPDIHPSLFST